MHTHPLHYCVVQGYDQARHSVASVIAGALVCRDAILATCMGAWLAGCHLGYLYGGAGLTRVRHDAEAWVPVAGCGMVLHGAENRKAVSLIITLYYAVVQGFTGLYKEGVPKVRSCIIDRITCQ